MWYPSLSTALVTNAWCHAPGYFDRLERWGKHHQPIAQARGWEIVVLDNASRSPLPTSLTTATRVRFTKEYTRPRILEYPYAWRAFYFFEQFFEFWEYDRIVFCESDCFLLSDRILDWCDTAVGMQSPYCPKYTCPEAGLIVLTRDCQPYRDFVRQKSWRDRHDENFELVAPWTHIEHLFIGDRYEDCSPPAGIDFAAQLRMEDTVPV